MLERPPPPPNASARTVAAFRAASDHINREVVQRAMEYPEYVAHHGDDAADTIAQGLTHTSQSLETALAYGTVVLLADQMEWAVQRLPHDGVQPEHVRHHLLLYRDAVAELLPAEEAAAVNRYVDWMLDYQRRLIAARR